MTKIKGLKPCNAVEHTVIEDGTACQCGYFTHRMVGRADNKEDTMKVEFYREQTEGIVKLIDDEIRVNNLNGNDAYNIFWENIKMALGYAVIH